MYRVIIFGGTTEGRLLAEFLASNGVHVKLCVATEHGADLVNKLPLLDISTKRLEQSEMIELIEDEKPNLVIDGTHPYAQIVTENAYKACKATGVEYIRLRREDSHLGTSDSVIYVDSIDEAVEYINGLEDKEGRILTLTGSKELRKYTEIEDYECRVVARVLSTAKVAAECEALGFKGENLVCMQGPFSEEMNKALISQCRARYIVTKDSGEKGGFEEKISAASACNCISIVVGRPRDNDGSNYYQVKSELCRRFALTPERNIKLIGIGPGKAFGLTVEAREAIAKADLAIGASRMIESIGLVHKNVLREYRSEEILDYINQHGEFERVVILLSGDTGFYSGAKKLGVLLEKAGFETEFIPGISSVNAFMSKIKSSWDDAVIVSNHGMKTSLIPLIRDNHKVVSILGKKDEVASLCRKLCQYDMEDVHVYIGENLSYDDEKVSCGSPRDYLDYENSPLAILCVINEGYKSTEINRLTCRHDDEFLRDKVPMTKEEVRVISIDRLRLGEDSICYDVGAGTGSVSVEMAIKASKGKVYAIEKKPEAVALIEKNKIKFRVDNIEVVEGFAPEAMEDLPAPTHVFIGGSSGNMDRIVESVLCKNRDARFVINCIAMESVAQAVECSKKYGQGEPDIVSVNVSRANRIGPYTMMRAENPIYIVSFGGGQK